jgi:hypothetical protein
MTPNTFDGFSVDLPDGWGEFNDDTSYSDPTEGHRKVFGPSEEGGVLYISILPFDEENPPSASPDYVEALALGWGRARGLAKPVSISMVERADGAMSHAEFKLAADYVEVWFLSNGEITLHVSYVCGWPERDVDRELRESVVASLTFA